MRSRSLAFMVALSCIVMSFAVALAGPGISESAGIETIFPVDIRGNVTDSIGTPIPGASVTVYIKRPDTTTRASHSTTTNSTGGYSVVFASGEWEYNDTVLVEADCGEGSGSESMLIEWQPVYVPILWVDVTIGVVIPEFPLGPVMPVAGVLGVFMMLFFARKRKVS